MKILSALSVVFACAALPTSAWGVTGHRAIGFVAEQYLSKIAKSLVSDILGEKYHHSLANASTWADDVRKTPEYKWSAALHFIDANDFPFNNSCSVNVVRDCADGQCILSAIGNYTWRLLEPTSAQNQIEEALKFLTHFYGDLGQPLHTENLSLGGNQVPVVCNGQLTSLHWAWDDGILDSQITRKFKGSPELFALWLGREIRLGAFSREVASWYKTPHYLRTLRPKMFSDGQVPLSPLPDEEDTPLEWAREANAYVCSVVFDFRMKEDLCEGRYADMAFRVMAEQIAKQGYRLAQTLNDIFDSGERLGPEM